MAALVAEFFEISGIETVPETLGELIPYMFRFLAAVTLVSGVFRFLGKVVEIFSFRDF